MKRIIPLLFLILFESVADIFAKKWADNQILWFAIASIIFYVICNTFWLFALKNGSGLGRGALIFSISSAILAIGIGYILFQERFTGIQIIGIVLGLIAIILVNL